MRRVAPVLGRLPLAWAWAFAVAGVGLTVSARAASEDEAALALADKTVTEPTPQRTCLESVEAAGDQTTYSDGRASTGGGRGSFNVRCDGALADGWRATLSDRFDYLGSRGSAAQAVNSLKEAYVSFRDGGTELLDVGRVNVREGAGFAYNPTDYFRANANRTIISIDPATLRDERMGTLMVRSQTLWSSGSLTALYAPGVNAEPNTSTLNPDFGATNGQSRWMVMLSQRLADGLQPKVSVTGHGNQAVQAGVSVTELIGRATVAYVEWSGGLSSRLSTGLTYTTPYKLSLTLEYEYNGAAPDARAWQALRTGTAASTAPATSTGPAAGTGPLATYVQYRQDAAARGELATRENGFAYVSWDDVIINRLSLTGFVRFDPYDHSRVVWGEARYHGQHAGIALQWQRNSGDATSDLAPWPRRQSWTALIDYYF
ncbi:MAG TPA: hypothetical protein VGM84_01970 [Steroidobacteraceae bacterium]|jgi:hypothetical protein